MAARARRRGELLTPRQARFVAEYLRTFNATKAAIAAGYSAKTAQPQGSRLLSNVMVAAAVAAGRTKLFAKVEITAERVLEEVRRCAFADPRRLFDEHGNLKAITGLSDEDAAAVASFEIIKKNAAAGDGVVDVVHKLKLWNKPHMLELLCKYLGLLDDEKPSDLPRVPIFALPNNVRPAMHLPILETKAIAGTAPDAPTGPSQHGRIGG